MSQNDQAQDLQNLDDSIDEIPESGGEVSKTLDKFSDIIHGTRADPSNSHDQDGNIKIDSYMVKSFFEYGMSVVKGRALPYLGDGQKPVQRRILYIMKNMGLAHNSKHVKSARVVGDVMGLLHPHGDSSIYEAMVASAQDFNRRYPLVDGQGNFGSRDGDGAAAMRYTEARLTKIAELLLDEIDMDTVDMVPNYDGSRTEPSILPARLPFILLNGAHGPAVGFACDIPSHNIREVGLGLQAMIKNPSISLDEMLQIIPAPDFPGGGQIITPAHQLRDMYQSGRGSIRMRARYVREELARGQWRLVINEFPDGVNAAKVMSVIEDASNPKPKAGRKELSQDQKNTKALLLSLIDNVRDESSEKHPVRLVIEPKTSRISEEDLVSALMIHTPLESTVSVGMVTVGNDGNPAPKGLMAIMQEWLEFRFTTVTRRTQFRLNQINARLHILEGRQKVFLRLDEVIATIRDSDEPKPALIEAFGLSEIQADDILEIRLRQLARLEGFKLEKEIKDLQVEGKRMALLLNDRAEMTKLILSEIEKDTNAFTDDRRTLVKVVAPARAVAGAQVTDEAVTVMISKGGWLRTRLGHGVDKSTITWKQSDSELAVLEMRTKQSIIILDTLGRSYSIAVKDIPGGRGDGSPVSAFISIQPGAGIAHVLGDDPSASYFFANNGNYGYITQLSNLETNQKAGKAFMTLEKGESILPPLKVSSGDHWIAVNNKGGKESRMVLFPVSEMKVMPKGRGVQLMALNDGESIACVGIIEDKDPKGVHITTNTGKEVSLTDGFEKFKLHRARKGCQISKQVHAVAITTIKG